MELKVSKAYKWGDSLKLEDKLGIKLDMGNISKRDMKV
jgi:hypothetical protein